MQYPRSTQWFCILTTILALCGCAVEPVGSLCDGAVLTGDLAISEILPNPEGADGEGFGEYIEIYNAGPTAIDLSGFRLAASRTDEVEENTHIINNLVVQPDGYVVLANVDEAEMPVYADYSYGPSLGALRNSNGRVAVLCGSERIDEAFYETSRDGKAIEQDGSNPPDSAQNDDPSGWCDASQEIVSFVGNHGSPGASNGVCGRVSAGTCMEDGVSRTVVKPAPGDLFVSEWMANPDGADGDLEWIEVLVAAAFDLNALQLGGATDSLKDVAAGAVCIHALPGDYLVIGKSEAAAPLVNATANFTLANSDTRSVVLGVDGTVIDRVDYAGTTQGRSWQIDSVGAVCLTNEDALYEYAAGNFGTPGTINPACLPVVAEGQCLDGAIVRSIRKPRATEVTITEWLANPAGADTQKEWFEVHFGASADLNGVVLSDSSASRATLAVPECIEVSANAYVVFAKNSSPAENGGLPDVLATFGFALNNSNETITVSLDGVTLDEVAYSSSSSGAATQVDGLGLVCSAEGPYGDGDNRGTPGATNASCP